MNACVYDGISNDWGGYYNTDQHPSCSFLKTTSLSGCAESSSSSEDLSSSSQGEEDLSGCSSASEENYSSEALRPCTDEDGPCFDDDGICSEDMSSSSSVDKYGSPDLRQRMFLVSIV